MVHALAGDPKGGCDRIGQAIKHGKNTEEIRQADELRSLKGCASYDAISASAR